MLKKGEILDLKRYGRIVENTDLLQTAQQVLPLFELLDADDNLVSCSFSDFLLEKTFVSNFFSQSPASKEINLDMCSVTTQTV